MSFGMYQRWYKNILIRDIVNSCMEIFSLLIHKTIKILNNWSFFIEIVFSTFLINILIGIFEYLMHRGQLRIVTSFIFFIVSKLNEISLSILITWNFKVNQYLIHCKWIVHYVLSYSIKEILKSLVL